MIRRIVTVLTALLMAALAALAVAPPANAAAGVISGSVTGPAGAPLSESADIHVSASAPGGPFGGWYESTPVSADGSYSLTVLNPASYKVTFTDHANVYKSLHYNQQTQLDTAIEVPVESGQVVPDINAELSLQEGISGVVRKPSGEPINGLDELVFVEAYEIDGTWGPYTQVKADGTYVIAGLAPGDYHLKFRSDIYATEFYDDATSLNQGTPVTVTPNTITANINADLEYGTRIAGRVTGMAGLDPMTTMVTLYSSNGTYIGLRQTTTDGYVFNDLSPGAYKLKFEHPTYRTEYYDNATSLGQANAVTVTANNTTVADVELIPRTAITGEVRDPSGELIDGVADPVYITVYASNGQAVGYTNVRSDGTYWIENVWTGQYRLKFSSNRYETEFYNGKASLAEATQISVTENSHTSGISTQLAAQSPSAPDGVVVAAIGDGSADVTWQQPSSDGGSTITGYTVTSTPGSKSCATDGATACTVTGLTNGTAYRFSVTASNSVGTSGASALSTPVTPAGPPKAPTNPTATGANESATVAWTAPQDNGGSIISGYTVTSTPGSKTCSANHTTTCTITGLTNGTSYQFSVTATNWFGTSAPSPLSPATTPTGPPTAPAAPTAIAGNESATVSWTASAHDGGSAITGYTVTSIPGTKTCTASNGTTCTVTGLTNGTSYQFSVTANSEVGASQASVVSNNVVPLAPTAPAPPQQPAAQAPARAQSLANPPRTIKRKKSIALARTTSAGVSVRWTSSTPKVCKVKGARVVAANKKGRCVLKARAAGNAKWLPLQVSVVSRVR